MGYKSNTAVVSAANANFDGTGTIVDITDVIGTNGARVEQIVCNATGTTTAGMLRIFKYDGTNWRAYTEIPVTGITPSATVERWKSTLRPSNLYLENTYKLGIATEKAETFHVSCEYVEF